MIAPAGTQPMDGSGESLGVSCNETRTVLKPVKVPSGRADDDPKEEQNGHQ
jgi:hypothetical protein